eukprot:TRINITY_DN8842_c0_g1_i1.p1 TRINITY_DN8842_c0_g1~~TRINITY_DN8842_c0_g1_i1.p1  ORF type:complete len:499 (+),score=92.10 TRINITY_DN8842_c0_g1_i1:48-1499(+)
MLTALLATAVLAGNPSPINPYKNCTLEWHTRALDHFTYLPETNQATFKQRVFVCGEEEWNPGQPIFFYCGNEADVTLYVEHTGLMWENRKRFKALLVFAEHRYYGESLPFGNNSFTKENIGYLNHEQALADYADLLRKFKISHKTESSKVIAFGGSYGGMLAAWMRMKYPSVIDGSISASAPILAFPGCHKATYDAPDSKYGSSFWDVVTRDATPAGGSRKNCDVAVKTAFSTLFEMGKTAEGRQSLQNIFSICTTPQAEDVVKVAYLQMYGWDMMAMGDYPYPSNYITNNGPILPPFPVREACKSMVDEAGNYPSGEALLKALAQATNLFNNATKTIDCYKLAADIEEDGIWDFQWCTEMQPQETYFARGANSMFWEFDYNATWVADRCKNKHGIVPRPYQIATQYGTEEEIAKYSNIVFSNGALDPWISGGVFVNTSTITSITIPLGAHHLDLFFSNPQDPQCVLDARKLELDHIESWLQA